MKRIGLLTGIVAALFMAGCAGNTYKIVQVNFEQNTETGNNEMVQKASQSPFTTETMQDGNGEQPFNIDAAEVIGEVAKSSYRALMSSCPER